MNARDKREYGNPECEASLNDKKELKTAAREAGLPDLLRMLKLLFTGLAKISSFGFRVSQLSRISIFVFRLSFLVLLPLDAFAHVKGGEVIGLLSGMKHPISGWDHVLAMIAVGLWGAQLGAPAVWLLPVTFPMVMAFGGLLGLLGVPLPGIEVGIAVSAMALGFAVFREARLKLWLAAPMVGFFAIFHGYAHGAELPPGGNGLLYSIGFVVTTGMLHATGIAIGLIHQWPAGKLVLRLSGAFVSVAGVLFLWKAIT